jgi:hypothetical protein
MWGLEEFEEYSAKKRDFLVSIGAASDALLTEAARKLESKATPHFAYFFQLPYPIYIDNGPHFIATAEKGIVAEVSIFNIALGIDARARITAAEAFEDRSDVNGVLSVAQFVVQIPVWGPRLQYFEKYRQAFFGPKPRNDVIVPKEAGWITGPAKPMTTADFEFSLCNRLKREAHFLLSRLLPTYSILALRESPMPKDISAFFVMPLPGYIRFNGLPETVIRNAFPPLHAQHTSAVSSHELIAALQIPDRLISRFEQQLLAMERICRDGEPALALIGTLSLCEWFVNTYFLVARSESGRQPGFSFLLKKTDALSFLNDDERQTFATAIETRNNLVHGAPPTREPLSFGYRESAGRQASFYGEHLDRAFAEKVILTAFALYRKINKLKSLTRSVGLENGRKPS